MRLWDADTGQPIGDPLTGHTGPVASVAFSPDGHRLATASADDTVRLWDADTGQPLGDPLTGHTGAVMQCGVQPRRAPARLRAATTRTVRLWPADASPDMLCAKLTTNMSHQQWRDWVSPDIDYIKACPGPSHPTGRRPLTAHGEFRSESKISDCKLPRLPPPRMCGPGCGVAASRGFPIRTRGPGPPEGHGTWGGLSGKERTALKREASRRQRHQVRAAPQGR